MDPQSNGFVKFFAVAARGQTYLNMLYLLLSFPLGIFYFVFFVTGFSAGIPLIIVWVGLLLLALVLAAWQGLILFERKMAIAMLGEDIPPVQMADLSGKTIWQKFGAWFRNPVTWKGLVFLLAKFPLGIASFVILVTFSALSLSLLAAPFIYRRLPLVVNWGWNNVFVIDTLNEAVLASLAGALLVFASMHIFNGVAWLWAKFAHLMLGSSQPIPAGMATGTAASPAPVTQTPAESVPPAAQPPAESVTPPTGG